MVQLDQSSCDKLSYTGTTDLNFHVSLPGSIDEKLLIELIQLIDILKTDTSKCMRTKTGCPSAGKLSMAIEGTKERLNAKKPGVELLLQKHSKIFWMDQLKLSYQSFDDTLNDNIDEGRRNESCSKRVVYLEKLNFISGRVKGFMEATLEHIKWSDSVDIRLCMYEDGTEVNPQLATSRGKII